MIRYFLRTAIFAALFVASAQSAHAVGPQSASGTVNVSAIVSGLPPTTPAIILSPETGATLGTRLLVVRGSCGPSLTVKLYNKGTLVGSTVCANDSTFVFNLSLDEGNNTLTTLNFDVYDQAGPASPPVEVTVLPAEATVVATPVQAAVRPLAIGSVDTPGDQGLFEDNAVEPIAAWLGVGNSSAPRSRPIITFSVLTAAVMQSIDAIFFELKYSQAILLLGRRIVAWILSLF